MPGPLKSRIRMFIVFGSHCITLLECLRVIRNILRQSTINKANNPLLVQCYWKITICEWKEHSGFFICITKVNWREREKGTLTRSISNSRERDKQLFSIDIDRTKKKCTKIERRVLKSENCSGKKEKIVFETCTAH